MPGKAQQVFTFLRDYKIPDGKPPNKFAYNNELKDKAFAMHVIDETHEFWQQLISNKIPNQTARYTIATFAISDLLFSFRMNTYLSSPTANRPPSTSPRPHMLSMPPLPRSSCWTSSPNSCTRRTKSCLNVNI
jgi:hypothetical protein